MHQEKIPVSLITGFLGSGKTTVINHLLTTPAMAGTAVLVNEFGQISIDGDLIRKSGDSFVELKNGCVCCSLNDDLAATLRRFMERRRLSDGPAFRSVLIETTGLANAGPIIATLMQDPLVREDYALDKVIATVDAIHGATNLNIHAESVEQVAVADCLVFTKVDRVRTPEERARLRDLRERTTTLNPSAVICDGDNGQVDTDLLFRQSPERELVRSTDPSLWARHHRHPGSTTDRGQEARSGAERRDCRIQSRHDRHIQSFCLVREAPIPLQVLDRFWSAVAQEAGPNLLRVKGIVHVAEKPDTPAVVQGVQEVVDEKQWLSAWPGDDRRTRLVFIGWMIDEERIKQLWEDAEGFSRTGSYASSPKSLTGSFSSLNSGQNVSTWSRDAQPGQ